jgi:hypothetical protein
MSFTSEVNRLSTDVDSSGESEDGSAMRWEEMLLDLFEDLEQQAEGRALAERDAEVAELSRAEYAQVDFASRLHASTGHRVVIVVAGLGHIDATIARVGVDWLLADDSQHEWILRTAAIGHVRGLSDRAVGEQNRPVPARVGLGSALRGVAESRALVLLHRMVGPRSAAPGRRGLRGALGQRARRGVDVGRRGARRGGAVRRGGRRTTDLNRDGHSTPACSSSRALAVSASVCSYIRWMKASSSTASTRH